MVGDLSAWVHAGEMLSPQTTTFRLWTWPTSPGKESEPVPGLRARLCSIGLSSYISLVEAWCAQMGAAFLSELEGAAEAESLAQELAEKAGLQHSSRQRLVRALTGEQTVAGGAGALPAQGDSIKDSTKEQPRGGLLKLSRTVSTAPGGGDALPAPGNSANERPQAGLLRLSRTQSTAFATACSDLIDRDPLARPPHADEPETADVQSELGDDAEVAAKRW